MISFSSRTGFKQKESITGSYCTKPLDFININNHVPDGRFVFCFLS